MPTEVWLALLAAGTSVLVALLTAGLALRTQRRVVELTHRFEEQRAERDARRDYEYDAKKRLYAECEPVLFEAMELAGGAQAEGRAVVTVVQCPVGFDNPAGKRFSRWMSLAMMGVPPFGITQRSAFVRCHWLAMPTSFTTLPYCASSVRISAAKSPAGMMNGSIPSPVNRSFVSASGRIFPMTSASRRTMGAGVPLGT